jgi:hypothetical protein
MYVVSGSGVGKEGSLVRLVLVLSPDRGELRTDCGERQDTTVVKLYHAPFLWIQVLAEREKKG